MLAFPLRDVPWLHFIGPEPQPVMPIFLCVLSLIGWNRKAHGCVTEASSPMGHSREAIVYACAKGAQVKLEGWAMLFVKQTCTVHLGTAVAHA